MSEHNLTKRRADVVEALVWKRYPFRARAFVVIANRLLTLRWSAHAALAYLDGLYKQGVNSAGGA